MKFTRLITGIFAVVAAAAPSAMPAEEATEAVETAEIAQTAEDVQAAEVDQPAEVLRVAHAPAAGGCSIGFVFARGSTEISPLGTLIGPKLQAALKKLIPDMQTFPVLYAASLGTNMSNDRTDAASIQKGVEAFNKAGSCGVIIAGGYSQGAAVMHNVVQKKLSAEMKNKLAGVALFGDTRNKQDGGHIKGFPPEKSKVWCNASDGVCGGALNVNAGHLSYGPNQINDAANYLSRLAKTGKAGKPSGTSGGSPGGVGGKKNGEKSAPKGDKPAPKGEKPTPKTKPKPGDKRAPPELESVAAPEEAAAPAPAPETETEAAPAPEAAE